MIGYLVMTQTVDYVPSNQNKHNDILKTGQLQLTQTVFIEYFTMIQTIDYLPSNQNKQNENLKT